MFRVCVLRFGAVALLGLAATAVQAESLTSAMTYAYENNPEIASAFIKVRSARQDVIKAGGAHLPTVGFGASISQSFQNGPPSPANPAGGFVTGNSDTIGLNYSQTLFDNFSSDAAMLAAQAGYEAQAHSATNTEQTVLLGVVTAYFNVVRDRRLVQTAQENIGFLNAQLQSARDRLELGEGTRLEVAQAEAASSQANAAYQVARSAVASSEAAYALAVGHVPGGLDSGFATARLPSSMDAALDQAQSSHPGLLASAAMVSFAALSAQATEAAYGPKVTLDGKVGVGGFTGTSGVSQSGSISLNLSIPIFVPDRDPTIEKANLTRIDSELTALTTFNSIEEAIRSGWAGYQSATAQIEATTAAVAATRLALEAVIDQNELGQATTLDVLNARSNLLAVEEQLIRAQAQRSLASYSVLAATGQLTAYALGLPVQPRTAEGEVVVPVVAPAQTDAWGNLR